MPGRIRFRRLTAAEGDAIKRAWADVKSIERKVSHLYEEAFREIENLQNYPTQVNPEDILARLQNIYQAIVREKCLALELFSFANRQVQRKPSAHWVKMPKDIQKKFPDMATRISNIKNLEIQSQEIEKIFTAAKIFHSISCKVRGSPAKQPA